MGIHEPESCHWGGFYLPVPLSRAEDLPVTVTMNTNPSIHLISLPNIFHDYSGPSSRLLPCTFSSLLERCLDRSRAPPGGHQKSTLYLHQDDGCDREPVEG